MREFTYSRATHAIDAAREVANAPGPKFIGGGTNLLDLMKLHLETPAHLVDLNRLPLDGPRRFRGPGAAAEAQRTLALYSPFEGFGQMSLDDGDFADSGLFNVAVCDAEQGLPG